jgi:cytochrome c
MRKLVLAALFASALPAAASAADAEAGKTVFNKCKACHQVGEGAKNAAGPNLNGIVGRAAGSVEGYQYSAKLKASGITWDEANLKEWVANPRKKVPGNKMVFPGLKDPVDVDNVVAYLATLK